jgi:hypothetical protein
MKTKILFEINPATKTLCVDMDSTGCSMYFPTSEMGYTEPGHYGLFRKDITGRRRCAACLAAERKAKEAAQ